MIEGGVLRRRRNRKVGRGGCARERTNGSGGVGRTTQQTLSRGIDTGRIAMSLVRSDPLQRVGPHSGSAGRGTQPDRERSGCRSGPAEAGHYEPARLALVVTRVSGSGRRATPPHRPSDARASRSHYLRCRPGIAGTGRYSTRGTARRGTAPRTPSLARSSVPKPTRRPPQYATHCSCGWASRCAISSSYSAMNAAAASRACGGASASTPTLNRRPDPAPGGSVGVGTST